MITGSQQLTIYINMRGKAIKVMKPCSKIDTMRPQDCITWEYKLATKEFVGCVKPYNWPRRLTCHLNRVQNRQAAACWT